MRLDSDQVYLSAGPAASHGETVDASQRFAFEPMAPALVATALDRVLRPSDGGWSWAGPEGTVVVAPLETSDDLGEQLAFAEARLLLDVELDPLIALLDRVRATAPAVWIAVSGHDVLYAPRAFAAAVWAGHVPL